MFKTNEPLHCKALVEGHMDRAKVLYSGAELGVKTSVMSSMLTSGVAVQDVCQQLSSSWRRLCALLLQHLPQPLFEGLDHIPVEVCTMISSCC